MMMSNAEAGIPGLEALSGFVLAEDLSYSALSDDLERRRSTPIELRAIEGQAEKDIGLAWGELECGLSPEITRPIADDHFEDATFYAERVLENRQRKFDTGISASELQIYLNAFRGRRFKQSVTLSNLVVIQRGVGELIDQALLAPIHTNKTHPQHITQPDHTPCFASEGDRLGNVVKLAMQLIFMRAGFKVFPASVRESRTDADAGQLHKHDHDIYSIDDYGKLPVKTKYDPDRKSAAYYANPTVYMAYGAITRRAVKEVEPRRHLKKDGLSEIALGTATLLSKIAQGEAITRSDDMHLNVIRGMTREVEQKILARTKPL